MPAHNSSKAQSRSAACGQVSSMRPGSASRCRSASRGAGGRAEPPCLTIGCMPWHGRDGRRLYYEDTGRGDPVVLMPGWGGTIIELNPLRAALSSGFRVIAVDLPGSGRSEPQPRTYDADYYHDDALTILGLLDGLGVAAAHLVGFSDGGEEAVLIA